MNVRKWKPALKKLKLIEQGVATLLSPFGGFKEVAPCT